MRVGVLLVVALLPAIATAQSREAKITEPRVYKIGDLLNAADVVALVKVLSGDTENYAQAVYKGEVIQSFKGPPNGATVYFGPFVGERLEWEYILFLRNAPKPIAPKVPNASYGTIRYSEIFSEGYSSMESSYTCTFTGKEIAEKCDYGVRVCTDYIKLPKSVATFPPEENDPPFGCRWVRKSAFVALLDGLGERQK